MYPRLFDYLNRGSEPSLAYFKGKLGGAVKREASAGEGERED